MSTGNIRKVTAKGRKPPGPKRHGKAAPKPARKTKPDYVPSDKDRTLVRLAASAGFSPTRIAALVGDGITSDDLNAHFAREMEIGSDQATLQVASNLFRMATAWPPIKGVTPTAAVFWMKSRAGWNGEPDKGAKVTIKGGAAGDNGMMDPTQVIEVSFNIGDDSKIKDDP